VATIHSTKYIGDAPTRYGIKHDVQAFVFRIKQADGELRDIHETYPMTLDPRSNFYKLLIALGISIESVKRRGVDPDKFVGKTLKISVYHKTEGAKHANVTPLPLTAVVDGDPDPQPCDGNDRTCPYPAELARQQLIIKYRPSRASPFIQSCRQSRRCVS
jgi:hypothetical protein